MEHIIELFVTGVGIIMSVGYFPQAWRIWRARSAASVSPVTFGILALGTSVWTLYGIYRHDWVIISGFALGMIGSWLVLWLMWRFRKGRGSAQG